jgi:ribosomal-protein-alanine N-acetyltransferase
MTKNFSIKQFEEEDLNEVIHINWTCLPEHYTKYFILNIYQRFPKTFLVAVVDEKIIGYIMCRIETGLSTIKKFSIARKGHIISIAVLPNYRRKGIGEALISTLLKSSLPAYNADECYLEVRPSNNEALYLYRKFGFEQVKVLNHYYRDGESAYVMALDLTKKADK